VPEPSHDQTLDKYKQAFQEEAREVLVELESALLELSEHRTDKELVGRVFRALHTIKGSGAMFGFDELAAFAHQLETAFDEVRAARLEVTSELLDVALAAQDQIRAMLEEAAGGAPAERTVAAGILAKLHKLTGLAESPPAGEAAPVRQPAAAATGAVSTWKIHFCPGSELLRNGANPMLLLGELAQLGDLRAAASQAAVPRLEELDPERCYISWDMLLTTAAGREAIRDVFIFVEDCSELRIEPQVVPAPGTEVQPPKASQERRTTFGRRAYDSPDNASSIRVPAARLDQFVNLVGELVTVQARLGAVAARRDDPEVTAVSEEIERLTAALRENSMSIRMLPIRATFERFRRLVHDLTRDLHKDVELVIEGGDTELDKTVIEQLNDPLMHLIRNSMDHGIEPSADRIAAGKPATATLCLSAKHSGANVLVEVWDDGAGINAEAVRARAVEKGLVAGDAQLTESEILSLILAPGFSTAKQVSDVSGRGVGMDVVKRNVEALRGTIEIASKPGAGTKVTLRLPLTMAIIDGLLVRIGKSYFVMPLANTLECVELTRQDVEKANGKHLADIRGELVPYIRLREYFNVHAERPEREQIMLTETEEGRYGFVVDQVLGDHQTVIKNLGRHYRHVQVISGATILGDGSVALILDPHRLAQDAVRTNSAGLRADSRARRARPEGAMNS